MSRCATAARWIPGAKTCRGGGGAVARWLGADPPAVIVNDPFLSCGAAAEMFAPLVVGGGKRPAGGRDDACPAPVAARRRARAVRAAGGRKLRDGPAPSVQSAPHISYLMPIGTRRAERRRPLVMDGRAAGRSWRGWRISRRPAAGHGHAGSTGDLLLQPGRSHRRRHDPAGGHRGQPDRAGEEGVARRACWGTLTRLGTTIMFAAPVRDRASRRMGTTHAAIVHAIPQVTRRTPPTSQAAARAGRRWAEPMLHDTAAARPAVRAIHVY